MKKIYEEMAIVYRTFVLASSVLTCSLASSNVNVKTIEIEELDAGFTTDQEQGDIIPGY